jgi:hypothetical protein
VCILPLLMTVLASCGFDHSATRIWNNMLFEIKNSPSIDSF